MIPQILIPLIKIHGGEAKYMVGKPYMVGSPHTWWPGQPAGQLWGARGQGPRARGVPHHVSGIRYQVSGIKVRSTSSGNYFQRALPEIYF